MQTPDSLSVFLQCSVQTVERWYQWLHIENELGVWMMIQMRSWADAFNECASISLLSVPNSHFNHSFFSIWLQQHRYAAPWVNRFKLFKDKHFRPFKYVYCWPCSYSITEQIQPLESRNWFFFLLKIWWQMGGNADIHIIQSLTRFVRKL